MGKVMICPRCRTENNQNAKFCKNCGVGLQKKDRTKIIVIGIIIFFICSFCSWGTVIFYNKHFAADPIVGKWIISDYVMDGVSAIDVNPVNVAEAKI